MRAVCLGLLAAVLLLSVVTPYPALTAPPSNGGIFRQPDVSATHIVFVYGDDLWLVPRHGGVATPLASPPGLEANPRFDPSGENVAFAGNYDGGEDLYVLPIDRGTPRRVTYHPSTEYLCDWTADGRLLFSVNGLHGVGRLSQLFTVSPKGGLPEQLAVPYGRFASLDAGGSRLAYNLNGGARANWKRYRGGQAADIWVVDLEARTSRQITDWDGNDTEPMWFGESVYYLTDAGPAHRMNIWRYDLGTSERRQVTFFEDADVRSPAIGPGASGKGEIVFQEGSGLHLLDLDTEKVRRIDIVIPGARAGIRPQRVDASKQIESWRISPTGKRALVGARGDIWTLSAKKGSPRNLTRTSGVRERDPSWSPDGKWVAYFSDASGEYELCITRADGKGETKQLTKGGKIFRFSPQWSPDSKRIAFTDKAAWLHVHDLESGKTVTVDHDPVVESEGMWGASWSHDGRWLAYPRVGDVSRNHSIHIWDRSTGESHKVTSDLFSDHSPVFDREGKYLYFVSNRSYAPRYSDHDGTFIYAATEVLLLVPLMADTPSPFAPESDEEEIEAEEADEEENGEIDEDGPEEADDGLSGTWEGQARNDEILPPGGIAFTLNIVLGGSKDVSGSLSLPIGTATITGGSFDAASGRLALELRDADGALWTIEAKVSGETVSGTATLVDMGIVVDFEGRRTARAKADAEKSKGSGKASVKGKKTESVEIDLDGFESRAVLLPVKAGRFWPLAVNHQGALIYVRRPVSGSGGEDTIQILRVKDDDPKEKTVASGAGSFVLSANGKHLLVRRGESAVIQKAAAGATGKPVSTGGMDVEIQPTEEWRQLVGEAWRIMRDYFYDPHMHGVDWKAARAHALGLLEHCITRTDVTHVITEMIGELNVGHANYWASPPRRGSAGSGVGMLGVDWALDQGAYRISKIVTGAPWDTDARGPLAQPGLDVKAGDYVLAVNGVPLDVAKAPWTAFLGLTGKPITLTVSEKPVLDDDAREILIKPVPRESRLRYRAWVEKNRAYVEKKTQGRVGYIHVPNTGRNGQNELVRQYQGQLEKQGMIIDERWNGGGQIPTRFIELLNRPVVNYWARRDGADWPCPYGGHQGPKCMLMNGNSGSGGDAFPHYFRQQGLGKLIGRRTWGGLVGISGNPGLIDGTYMSVPTFAFYELDGTWGIEGHGVDPDIDVIDDPALMFDGGDPQLDAAIGHMLEEIERIPFVKPKRPAYPDREGMGIAPEDK